MKTIAMHVPGNRLFDLPERLQALLMSVRRHAPGDHFPDGHIQRGKLGCAAIVHVVMPPLVCSLVPFTLLKLEATAAAAASGRVSGSETS